MSRSRARDRSRGHGAAVAFNPTAIADIWSWWQTDVPNGSASTTTTTNLSLVPRVRSIADRSGNSRTLIRNTPSAAAEPTWCGRANASGSQPVKRPTMRFAAESALNTPATTALSDWTFACRLTPVGSGYGFLGFNYPTAANTGIGIHTGANGVKLRNDVGAVAHTATITAQQQYCLIFSKTGNTVTVSVDGVEEALSISNLAIGNTTTALLVGAHGDGTTLADLFLDELIVYTRGINAGERANLMAYLRAPSRVPLLSAGRPVILGVGNSMMAGQDASVTLRAKVSTLVTTSHFGIDQGIGAQTTTQMNTAVGTQVQRFTTDPGWSGSQTYVLVQELINELTVVQNPTTVKTTTKAYCSTIQGYSAKVLLATATGRNGEGTSAIYAGYAADYLTLNAALRADGTPTWDALIDHGGDANIGTTPVITGDTYRAVDGSAPNRAVVHWTDAGQAIAANYYDTAMAMLGVP